MHRSSDKNGRTKGGAFLTFWNLTKWDWMGGFWFFRILCGFLLICVGILFLGLPESYGKEPKGVNATYENPDTGYQIYVEDEAELLTEEQRTELGETMQEITAYGNAAFVTTEENVLSTENFARSYYMDRFGTDSGTVFVIDMDNRNIWIHSDGAIYKVITTSYANTITDNVYRYASKGDYYECAKEAFEEIYALLEGQRIAQPMKYISNALLAMILALLINFGLIIFFTRLHKPKADTVIANIHRKFNYSNLKAVHTHQTRIYDPVSRGSSGGSGHSGGGGGRSGGGGGHSF